MLSTVKTIKQLLSLLLLLMPSPSRPKVSQFRFLDQRLQDLELVSLPPSGF